MDANSGLQVCASHGAGLISIAHFRKMLLSMVSVSSIEKVRDERDKVL